jgi:cell division protein FtsB
MGMSMSMKTRPHRRRMGAILIAALVPFQLDLAGGGFKKQVTKQSCDQILAQGKSLL